MLLFLAPTHHFASVPPPARLLQVLPPLVKLMGGKAVQPYSAKLVEALLPHLRHRHAAVRVATLEALEHTLLAGAGSSVSAL